MKLFHSVATAALLLCLSIYNTNAQTHMIVVETSKGWCYSDLQGNIVIPPIKHVEKYFPFSPSGLAVVFDGKISRHYFINLKGERIKTEVEEFTIKRILSYDVSGFDDGLTPVKINGKWGFFNTKGELSIKPVYEKIEEFDGGFAIGKRGKNYYIINTNGIETHQLPPTVNYVDRFCEGLAKVRTTNGKFGFVDTTGQIVIESKLIAVGNFHGGLAWVRTIDELIGFINTKGEWVIKPTYTYVHDFDPQSGIAKVVANKETIYIDQTGQTIRMANGRESFSTFCEGLAKGEKNGYWGFYDNKGNWVIKPTFDGVRNFPSGYAAAKSKGDWGIINAKGEWVIEPKFKNIRDVVIINQQ